MPLRSGLALFAGVAALAAVFVWPPSATVREATRPIAGAHAGAASPPANRAHAAAAAPSHPAAKMPPSVGRGHAAGNTRSAGVARASRSKPGHSTAAASRTSFTPAGSAPAAAIRQAARSFVLAEVTGNATLYCSLLTNEAQIALAEQASAADGTPLENCEADAGTLLATTAQPDTLSRYDALIAEAPVAIRGDTAVMAIGSQNAELQLVDGQWLFSQVD